MAYLLLPLICTAAVLSVLVAWVFLRTPIHYWLKVVLLPAILLLWLVLIGSGNAVLGYAYPGRLPDKFTLIAYNVVITGQHKQAIEVWVDGSTTRLYVVPYSKPLEQALEQGMRKGKGGGAVDMVRKQHPGINGGHIQDPNDDDYESNLRLPSDDFPKDNPS